MAVGAYAAAFLGVKLAPHVSGALGSGALADGVTFNLALIAGGVLAGLTGLVVGIPSLRLRGDYLAVVTLGFGEIIRILFNNATFLGAATGYFGNDPAGLPAYTTFFWVFFWVVLVRGRGAQPDLRADRSLAVGDPRRRDRGRGHGHADHAAQGHRVRASAPRRRASRAACSLTCRRAFAPRTSSSRSRST